MSKVAYNQPLIDPIFVFLVTSAGAAEAEAGVPGMPRHTQYFAPAFTKDQVST